MEVQKNMPGRAPLGISTVLLVSFSFQVTGINMVLEEEREIGYDDFF